jgi:hypothetical protein
MILHPDGRIEGTPQEILEYSKLTSPAPTDEEKDATTESLNEALEKAVHAAKTPIPSGKQEAIKNTFLKGIPWLVEPGSIVPLSSCPVCKSKVKFQKGFITEQEY